jgi:hypothetical protein
MVTPSVYDINVGYWTANYYGPIVLYNLFRQINIFYWIVYYLPTYLRKCCISDRLCGLMVRVPGYRSRGPGSISSASRLVSII